MPDLSDLVDVEREQVLDVSIFLRSRPGVVTHLTLNDLNGWQATKGGLACVSNGIVTIVPWHEVSLITIATPKD